MRPTSTQPTRSRDPHGAVTTRTTALIITVALLAAGVSAAVLTAQVPSWRAAAEAQAAGRDSRYRQGQEALDQHRWSDAAALFKAVADTGSNDSDAARYWQAWAEWKGGDTATARRTLAALRQNHPDSPWQDDARSLAAEMGARPGRAAGNGDASSADDSLKLYALNSLMSSDAPQAVDAVERLLNRTDDPKLRERALFVLSQSSVPRAAEILANVARGHGAPELQRTAVRYLGMAESDANIRLLESIYGETSSLDVKTAVIEAYFLADDETRLLALAKGETNEDLRGQAIEKLGLVDARESLATLYRATNDVDDKQQILHALALADAKDFMLDMAKTETDRTLRTAAIHNLGWMDANDELRALYESVTDPDLREAVLHSLFVADDAEALVAIAKRTDDASEREAAVRQLSVMDDNDVALAYLLEILDN